MQYWLHAMPVVPSNVTMLIVWSDPISLAACSYWRFANYQDKTRPTDKRKFTTMLYSKALKIKQHLAKLRSQV